MSSMKAIQYHQYGGPEVMRLEQVEVPVPGKGQLLVRVRAAGVNAGDFVVRGGGVRMVSGRRFPRGLGYDFAGVVESVGPGVTHFAPGDEVFGGVMIKPSGAFADFVIAEEKYTAKKPAALSFEEAGSIATAGATGRNAIVKSANLKPGQRVFITGCLGAVGRTAAQYALLRGASVAGSCRATSYDEAESLGIDPVVGFDFDPTPYAGSFDLVYDTAGSLSYDVARSMLRPGGLVLDPVLAPSKIIRALFNRNYKLELENWDSSVLDELAQHAVDGTVCFPVARTVPLDNAIDAITELERHRIPSGGKLVVTP